MVTVKNKRITWRSKRPELYAVLPDGTECGVESIPQLMCMRRLAVRWMNKYGEDVPPAHISAILKQNFGFFV